MRRKVFSLWILLILFVFVCPSCLLPSTTEYKQHLFYLASDKLEGRAPGTEGIDLAADYIAKQFKTMKLKPGGDDNSYFQKMTIKLGAKLVGRNALAINDDDFVVEQDFIPLGFSDNGEVSGQLICAGFAIISTEHRFDDFKNIDCSNKIALVFTGEPGENDSTSRFDGIAPTIHSDLRRKVINAKLNGANAVIFINGLKYYPDDLSLPTLRQDVGYHNVGIPVIQIRQETLLKFISKDELLELQENVEKNIKPRKKIFDKMNITLSVNLQSREETLKNVIGVLPGTDTTFNEQPLIIGAHYDHLGYGGPASNSPGIHEIHNGADDNASGVAALIGIAQKMSAADSAFKRPVVYIAFTGEEIGMIGSTFYSNHPNSPINQTVAMLNLDAVGRMVDQKLIVFGTGTAREWERILAGYNHKYRFAITMKKEGNSPSDHAIFFTKGIPVLHFFTGANSDYHKPTDDAEKINFTDLSKLSDYACDIAMYLANREKPLTFLKGEKRPPMASRSGHGGKRPWFGSVPDFSYQGDDGLKLSGVSAGGPCEQAGLTAGDLIIQIGDVKIKSIYELTHILQNHKSGDTLDVKYIRNGEQRQTKVTLSER